MSYLKPFSIANLEKYNPIFKGLETVVSGFQSDSRKIKQGDIFIALKGLSVDGFLYALQAENAGAVCIISDSDFAKKHQDGLTIPVVYDQDVQKWLPKAIKDLSNITATLIGVTGTNGKTSITHYIAQAINAIQKRNNCNVIGTAGNGDITALSTSVNTTPDILDFYDFVLGYQQSQDFIAVEVSSHGIALNRVKDVDFQVKVFSNITQDHLDFHKDFKDYFDTKSKWFFEGANAKVINIDDPRLRSLKFKHKDLKNLVSYGLKNDADVCAKNVEYSTKSIAFDLMINGNEIGRYNIELIGDFNLGNVLACVAVLVSLEFPILDIVLVLSDIKSVSGRMQKIQNNENVVVVDYAHTPDALEKSLKALSLQKTGKLICLFGCGGDRDKTKRPKMAKVAQDLSDQIFITNDNPRYEKPEDIVGEILEGLDKSGKNKSSVILDRKQAIETAISLLQPGDVLLVAGKGHENYQLVKNKKLPFSDVYVINQYFNEVSHDTY